MEHLRITVAGKAYDVVVEKLDSSDTATPVAPVQVRSAAPAAARPAPSAPKPVAAGSGDATSPLAGIVQAIALEVGAPVNEGDLVITLEAMKMYTAINAPTSGTIKAILVKVGDAVDEGQVLYTIG
ncbi:MAG: biotin/lipoyl-containing protein [Verrucomicrobiota bacterium]